MAILFTAASSMRLALTARTDALSSVNAATLTAWVNMVSFPSASTTIVAVSTGNAANPRALMGFASTNQLTAGGRVADPNAYQSINSGSVFPTGSWVHVAATLDYANKIIRLYQNGSLIITSGTLSGWTAAPTGAGTSAGSTIGSASNGGSQYLNGSVADVRIYDRLLSTDEVLSISNARGQDTSFYRLRHWYPLTEGVAGVAATVVP